jgi:hypothetical protein
MPAASDPTGVRPLVRSAMAMAAVVMAYHVAARATRDTLFLTNYPMRSLPAMVAVSSALAIVAAILATRAMSRLGGPRFLRAAYGVSAALALVEAALVARAPGVAAVLVYVHVAALGPVLVSGFWSTVNERLDPRSAKRAIGVIAGVGTLGGLVGGAAAERLTAWQGVIATFPALALAHAWCAWSIGRVAAPSPASTAAPGARGAHVPDPPLSLGEGARRIVETPYLQNLALLVFGTALCAGLLDYAFKAQASAASGGGLDLMRAFALYYAGVSLLTFAAQTFVTGPALERAGLARTIGTLPAVVVAGGAAAALATNPWTVAALRGTQAVLEGSLFRAGREVLYSPIPARVKRATRMLIEIACDRGGEIASAALVSMVLASAPLAPQSALLGIAVPCAAIMLFVVARVQSGYVSSLEEGLRAGRVHLDATMTNELTTQRMLATMTADPRALVAVLLDPRSPFDARRSIPARLALDPSPVAVAGLVRGLADARFEVRYRCGRALARLVERDPGVAAEVDADAVLAAIRREAALGRKIWDSQRDLDRMDEPVDDAFVDAFLRERSGRSLEHVFTLLSLVLPAEPLRIAFRGLHADDRQLRGTALEYLDTVLPADVHAVLWPYLDPGSVRPPRVARGAVPEATRDRAQVLDDLMRSNRSIELNLEELRRRAADAPP